MSEELKDIELKETQKETKKTSRKKQQNVEVETVEETAIAEVEVVENTKVVEDEQVEITEQVVNDEMKAVETQTSTEEKNQVFDIKKIKREAVKYNHVVFTYSDGFICHAKSKYNADLLHKEYLKK